MKIITCPATVELKDVQGEALPFKKWLLTHIDTFEGVKTPSQVRRAAKIAGAIEESNGTVTLEDEDYEILKSAVASVKYVPKISRQVLSYYDAVDKAQEVEKK